MEKSTLNIPSYIQEPNYRYQMPRMILKIEGKGNGIKTNVVNMNEVSKALRVPTEYPLKFMGIEYGSQIIFKEKGNDVSTIINGSFKEEQLQKTLDKFIEKYVLCPKCKYPEFVLRVKQNTVCGKCDSCGERAKCDNTHKFASYIIKNPPKLRGINKEEQKNQKEEIVPVGQVPVPADKQKDLKKEKKVEEKDLVKNIKKLEASDLLLESENLKNKVEQLTECIKGQRNQANIIKEIKDFQINKGLENQISHIVFQSIFTVNIAHEVDCNAELLQKLYSKLKIQKMEDDILLNLQYFFYKTYQNQDFTQYIPTILKIFYDNNLISEQIIVDWADNKIDLKDHFLYNEIFNNKFKEDTNQIVEWLRNADYDEQEEEVIEETEEQKQAQN
ncbi:hypothetical protein IMG5_127620 [Ichthyophthirius multifiliis]|uniref:W2 domain-containing protein n=1 Tax=Ichthyophthirius multifiliis TaxID=5932 RepID=G0QVY8_ICHMU|nr:hypothetical protein IMG5_127620 [Ichthyophthirius multifiliis]EGR30622.1 hypothetical protein IMG5_127620 [Ichthyophthirius multifiliis]|eukprot:XP_004032209.1 hypothetical protein IMG5_127620 [Ichthyophthirius multifiliis]